MKNTVLVLGDLFNVLPDAIVVVDGAGLIVFANASVKGLLDYSADELMGQPLNCLIPESYRKANESHFADSGCCRNRVFGSRDRADFSLFSLV